MNKTDWGRHLGTQSHQLGAAGYKQLQSELSKDIIIKANDFEKQITNLYGTRFKEHFSEVIRTGDNTSCTFDIIVKFKDESFYRGIQVKLYRSADITPESFMYTKSPIYDDNNLIIAGDPYKNRYTLLFYKDVKNSESPTFNFNLTYANTSIKNFKDIEEMYKYLIEYTRKSVILTKPIREYIAETGRIEYDSTERVKSICTKLGLEFKNKENNYDAVDFCINNSTIQLKTSCDPKFKIDIYRCEGRRGKKVPYKNREVDFFIFEFYKNELEYNFFIIPNDIMYKYGYLSDEKSEGKKEITLCNPNFDSEIENYDTVYKHWCIDYINNFEVFNSNLEKTQINNIINESKSEYKLKQITDNNIKIETKEVSKTVKLNIKKSNIQITPITQIPVQSKPRLIIKSNSSKT